MNQTSHPDRNDSSAAAWPELIGGQKTVLMGILNVTPDSFSDGSLYDSPAKALAHAEQMSAEGADMLDIGAESTRPGSVPLSSAEEWARLEPVLRAVLPAMAIPCSIDTYKASIAEKALQLGVSVVNDIWGLQKDPEMAAVVATHEAGIVIMHNQEGTEYDGDLMASLLGFFEESLQLATSAGISEANIALDPGIGFGKTPEQNIAVLKRLSELNTLGFPVLLGASRKSVIGRTLNLPVEQRLEASLAIHALGVRSGARIIRAHDIAAHRRALDMCDAILGG